MQLYITEKPSVAADIAKALNFKFQRKEGYFDAGDTVITWCYGHLLKSREPEDYNESYKHWRASDLPLKLHPIQLEPIADKKAHTKQVISLIKQADLIIHAGDPDDEGQLLVDELLLFAKSKKPVKRLLINDNTDAAIKKALANLQDNSKFHGIFQKTLARTTGDLIYGLSMTRAYTLAGKSQGYSGVLSVGRVQTPILGLIVRRFLTHQAHTASFFYTLTGAFNVNDKAFTANWQISNDAPKDEKNRLISKNFAEELAAKLKGKDAVVNSIKVEDKHTAPPLPFNLVKLQQHMNQRFKLTAARTLEITQTLREKHKAITYNRSDCCYLSEEQYEEAPKLVQALLKNFTELSRIDIDVSRKSKAFDNKKVTAHTAIIPTCNVPKMEALTIDEKNVYKAILDQYIVQFQKNKSYKEVTVNINVNGEAFTAKAQKIIDAGFTSFLKGVGTADTTDTTDTENKDADTSGDVNESGIFELLKDLKQGLVGICDSVLVNERKTTPPPLFTESTLLAALVRIADFVENPKIKSLLKEKDKDKKDEHGGIGTPATRSDMLEKLKKRGFIKLEKDKLIPTQIGIDFLRSLPEEATLPDMTALWSEKQTEIERGTKTIDEFVSELIADLEEQIKNVTVSSIKLERDEIATTDKVKQSNQAGCDKLDAPCPNCSKEIKVLPKLFVCSNCSFKIWSTIADKKLTKSMVETLLKKGTTIELKGFKSKAGKEFSAKLTLQDKVTGKVGFVFN